jgi:hypothetical protein
VALGAADGGGDFFLKKLNIAAFLECAFYETPAHAPELPCCDSAHSGRPRPYGSSELFQSPHGERCKAIPLSLEIKHLWIAASLRSSR